MSSPPLIFAVYSLIEKTIHNKGIGEQFQDTTDDLEMFLGNSPVCNYRVKWKVLTIIAYTSCIWR